MTPTEFGPAARAIGGGDNPNVTPRKVDLPVEQRRVRGQSLIAVWSALGFSPWSPSPGVAERLALVLRADVIVALWVVIAIRMAPKVRFESRLCKHAKQFKLLRARSRGVWMSRFVEGADRRQVSPAREAARPQRSEARALAGGGAALAIREKAKGQPVPHLAASDFVAIG